MPTSTVCACDLFPAYSSKLHCDAPLPPEFANLCLPCVYTVCSSVGSVATAALYRWMPQVEDELSTYGSVYRTGEVAEITAAIPKKAANAAVARAVRCAEQLLERLGAAAGGA